MSMSHSYLWGLILAVFVLLMLTSTKEGYTTQDTIAADEALERLHATSHDDVPEVTSEQLQDLIDDIYLVKTPREGMKYFHSENTRLWPHTYFSFPYNYKYGGAWPKGMYSRLRHWSPGFYTGTGWSYYLRPGMGYKYWPRGRWIRNTTNGGDSYYYISNRGDYTHNAANYADTNLRFP